MSAWWAIIISAEKYTQHIESSTQIMIGFIIELDSERYPWRNC